MNLNQTPHTLYRDAVRGAQTFEFSFGEIDRLGAPLWTVAAIGADGALSDGFGYGPNLERAQTSAWGETLEWFAARQALKVLPRVRASYQDLKARGENALDPVALNLSAGSPYHDAQTLEWVEVSRHPDGLRAWCPIEFVAPRAADIGPHCDANALVSVPITNGLGAGPTRAHALAHGVLELLQRDGNSVSYRALDRGIQIELDEVRDPQTRALLRHLDEQGIAVMAKLAALDFGMTNLYVVGHDRDLERAPSAIALSACGEAVHPDREIALGKALREFCMARARKTFNHGPLAPIRKLAPPGYLEAFRPATMRSEDDRALREMRAWMALSRPKFFEMLAPIFAARERVRFSELPTTPLQEQPETLTILSERLKAQGLEIYACEFTPVGAPVGAPVQVLRAIVPGLEVETMTYRRIGARNLERLLERGSPLVGQGRAPATAQPIRLTPTDAARLPGAWFDAAKLDEIIGPLYPLYREPGRHVLGFLEENTNKAPS